MATFTNVPAASAVRGTRNSGRVGGGTRPSSAGQIDDLSDSGRATGQQFTQSGFAYYPQGGGYKPAMSPLVFSTAASFAASLSTQQLVDSRPARVFLTDLQHAVDVYEHNMKLTSGDSLNPGNVVNRFW